MTNNFYGQQGGMDDRRPKAYILIGVPGSGKSTWTKKLSETVDFVHLSSDKHIERFAESIGATYSEVFLEYIKRATIDMNAELDEAIKNKKHIVWDQTNVSKASRKFKIGKLSSYRVIAVEFPTPDEVELKRRLDSRPGKFIPADAMRRMISGLEPASLDEGFDEIWRA